MADPVFAEDDDEDFPPEPDTDPDMDDDGPPLADPVALPPPPSEAGPLPTLPERSAEGGTGGAEGGGGDGGGGGFLVWNGPAGGDLAGLPWLDAGADGANPVWSSPVADGTQTDFGLDGQPLQLTVEPFADAVLDVFY